MIELGDPVFWAVVAGLAVAVRSVATASRLRMAAYLFATLILFHRRPGWETIALLSAATLYGWFALWTLTRASSARLRRAALVAHSIVFSAMFVASQHAAKVLPDLPVIDRVLPVLGLPYLYLRFLHLAIDLDSERIERPSLLEYLVFMLPFHQLIAGPIERFQAFRSQLDEPVPALDRDTLLRALDRITNGFLKKTILADLLVRTVGFEFEGHGVATIIEMDLYALWIYLDFSGYMDIVIGAGILAGWRPPENFRWPYFSRNIIEFWTRWHISLGDWVRDYIFNPLNLQLQRGVLAGRPLLAGITCYLVGMVFVGLWHRADVQFASWGVLHGLGIVACKLWESGLKQAFGRDTFKRYRASRVAQSISTVVTFQYVAASFIVAFYPPARALQILGGVF